MPLARFFHLATWHAALAITKGHFTEVTGSACRAVALVIVTCFTVSPSPLFHIYQLFLFVYCNISIASYWFAVLRHDWHVRSFVFRGFPDVLQTLQGNCASGRVVAVAFYFCIYDIQYQVLMSAWVPTILSNRFSVVLLDYLWSVTRA